MINELQIKSTSSTGPYKEFFGTGKIKRGVLRHHYSASCREIFIKNIHNFFPGRLLCLNIPNQKNAINTIRFIRKAEKVLKLKKVSKFSYCKHILAIKVSSFWKKSSFRMGIFTILTKIGYRCNNQKNFFKILKRNDYTSYRSSREGFILFFKGFTRIKIPNKFIRDFYGAHVNLKETYFNFADLSDNLYYYNKSLKSFFKRP